MYPLYFGLADGGLISSFLLNFAYTEVQEIAGNYDEVHRAYEKFLEVLRVDLETLEAKIKAEQVQDATSTPPSGDIVMATADTGTVVAAVGRTTPQAEENKPEKPVKNKEVDERRKEYGLAWTMYIRFARRAQGSASSRPVFAKARRYKWTPWEVYESAGASGLAVQLFLLA